MQSRFAALRKAGNTGLIPFLTAGDPSMTFTEKAIRLLDRPGVVAIELGVPFSDPLADGPIIQRSSERALAGGATLPGTLDLVERLREKITTPIVIMTYFNPVLRFGLERFARRAARAGVEGVIVTDLPVEEGKEYRQLMRKHGIGTVFLAAPTSSESRIRQIDSASTAFLYYVSMTGTTGSGTGLPNDVLARLDRLRALIRSPLAIGFGVTSPGDVKKLAPHCDAVVVGSALVKAIEEKKTMAEKLSALDKLVGRLVAPLVRGGA